MGLAGALVSAGYYVWIEAGYLNPWLMVVQWALTLSGGILLAIAASNADYPAARILRGGHGVLLGCLVLAAGGWVSVVLGFSQPGYLLVEFFLFALGFVVVARSLAPEAFLTPGSLRGYTTAGCLIVFATFGYVGRSLGAWYVWCFAGLSLLLGVSLLGQSLGRLRFWLLVAGCGLFTYFLLARIPAYSTDELALDSYAAYVFSHGGNPYAPSALAAALVHYHLGEYYVTPLTTSGYVDWLSYPALSFLLLLPAVGLGLQTRLVLVAMSFVMFGVVYARYRKQPEVGLFALLALLVDVNLLNYPAGSVPDVLWALPLGLSFVFSEKTGVSGIFYGLSVAAKQIPALIFPYYGYMVYRRAGVSGLLRFTGCAGCVFLGLNSWFIAASPAAWLHDVVSPISAPLVASGQGLSELSFLGYFGLPKSYFVFMVGFSALLLFVAYVKAYPRSGYAFLGFPLIMMFFGYRFLFDYILYWPVLAVFVLPGLRVQRPGAENNPADEEKENEKKKPGYDARRIWVPVALLFLGVSLLGGIGFHYMDAGFRVYSVGGFSDPLGVPQAISQMSVNVSWEGALNFRIFEAGPVTSVNGLVWTTIRQTVGHGWSVYVIRASSPSLAVANGSSFKLEAYYGGTQAFYYYLASASRSTPG